MESVKCGWLVYLAERLVRGIGPSVSCLRGVMFVECCICGGSNGDGLFTLWGVLFVGCHVCGVSCLRNVSRGIGPKVSCLWGLVFLKCLVCFVSHVDGLFTLWGVMLVDGWFTLWSVVFVGCLVCGVSCLWRVIW